MIIEQKQAKYRPIKITLKKKAEAKAFFNLLHAVEAYRCHSGVPLRVGEEEARVLVQLINADTDEEVSL